MKITWDRQAQAVYVYLTDEKTLSEKTVKVDGCDEVYLDYDVARNLIGIEILNVETPPVVVDVTALG